jgi:hypothetical protein
MATRFISTTIFIVVTSAWCRLNLPSVDDSQDCRSDFQASAAVMIVLHERMRGFLLSWPGKVLVCPIS